MTFYYAGKGIVFRRESRNQKYPEWGGATVSVEIPLAKDELLRYVYG